MLEVEEQDGGRGEEEERERKRKRRKENKGGLRIESGRVEGEGKKGFPLLLLTVVVYSFHSLH